MVEKARASTPRPEKAKTGASGPCTTTTTTTTTTTASVHNANHPDAIIIAADQNQVDPRP